MALAIIDNRVLNARLAAYLMGKRFNKELN